MKDQRRQMFDVRSWILDTRSHIIQTVDKLPPALPLVDEDEEAVRRYTLDINRGIHAHEIIENLFLGDYEAYREVSRHERILSTVIKVSNKPHDEPISHFHYYALVPGWLETQVDIGKELEDDEKASDMLYTRMIKEAFKAIDATLIKGGIVLVHCDAGVSRSAAVVIGYLVYRFSVKAETANLFVKSKRPWVDTNFFKMLKEKETTLINLGKASVHALMPVLPQDCKAEVEIPFSKKEEKPIKNGKYSALLGDMKKQGQKTFNTASWISKIQSQIMETLSSQSLEKTLEEKEKSLFISAHEIIEGLFLGNYESYAEEVSEHKRGISTVIKVVGKPDSNPLSPHYLPPAEGVFHVDISQGLTDNSAHSSILYQRMTEKAFKAIDDALIKGQKVLVYSSQGVSRSAAVVIGYLVYRFSMAADIAYLFVKNKRPLVDTKFFEMLREKETTLINLGKDSVDKLMKVYHRDRLFSLPQDSSEEISAFSERGEPGPGYR